MQPDYKYLMEKTGIQYPLIGFYDTPVTDPFIPVKKSSSCLFAHYRQLISGTSVVLSKNQYGCGGAGTWLCNVATRSRDQYIEFLADEEGLKAGHSLMDQWLDFVHPYEQEHEFLVVGTLKENAYGYLKTVTFFVNPDQLSMLMIGAQYYLSPREPASVIAPFGSGCMQLITLFRDLKIPQAVIGATDMAMRKYLPPEILAFTTTKPMFELLCRLDSHSFLEKRFIADLKGSRNRKGK
jgi:hypothetical protein